MGQLEESYGAYIEHYGVKGQKWGVRRRAYYHNSVAGRLRRANETRKTERAAAQKHQSKKLGRALLGEQPSKHVKRKKPIDIRIFDDDSPKVKVGKVAVQAALGVLIGATLASLNKYG